VGRARRERAGWFGDVLTTENSGELPFKLPEGSGRRKRGEKKNPNDYGLSKSLASILSSGLNSVTALSTNTLPSRLIVVFFGRFRPSASS